MHYLRLSVALCGALCTASVGLAAGPDVSGVTNFHQVNEHVYRGAQPSENGFQNLAKIGIKTILDLRDEPDLIRAEKRVVEAAGMRFVSIPMHGMSAPTQQDLSKALELLNDSDGGPVFVHCRRGADRTGTVIACYRVSNDHWQNDKALQEAKSFGMSWLEISMHHYILAYHPSSTSTPTVAATSQQ
jgi:tyrosine-protein phosphatase SIW14